MIVGSYMKLSPPSTAAAAAAKIALSLKSPSIFLSFSHPFSSSLFDPFNPLPTIIKTHKHFLDPSLYRSAITSFAIRDNPINAFFSFVRLTLSDRSADPIASNSLLAALSSNGYFDFSKIVLATLLFRRTPLSNVGFGVLVNSISRIMELEKVLSFLDEVGDQMEGINGSIIAFLIIDGLCRASRFSDASQALENLRCRGLKPDFMAYRAVVEGFRSVGRVDEVVAVSKRKRKFGVAPRMNEYGEYIVCLISEGRTREAKELGEAIIKGDFPIDDAVLNTLIASISKVEANRAIVFLKYMVQKERYPPLSTFRDLSQNLCRNGKIDEMWNVFQLLDSKSYFSDLERYKLSITLLCESGRVIEAYSVLTEMRKNNCCPDVSTYNAVMEACCREDLLRPAKKLWDEMFTHGCEGNLQTYNILIGKLSDAGQVQEANHLFCHMLEKGVRADDLTYTSLIKGLYREGKLDSAEHVFKTSLEQDTVLADSTLNKLVHSLCKEGNFLAASKVMRSPIPSNIDSFKSHIILLKILADAREIDMAIEHIEWIRDNSSLRLDAISCELVSLLSFSSNPEPILQMLQGMMKTGLASANDPWINICSESFSW